MHRSGRTENTAETGRGIHLDRKTAGNIPGKKLKFEVEAATGKWSAETIPSSPKELLWSHPTGNTFHHYPVPSVHGDRLFLGLSAGNRDKTSGGVLCLDRMTGKQIWRVQQGVNVSSAVTDGKAVYALTNEGELLTLDCADGRLLRKQTPEFGTLKESHAYWRLVQVPMRLVNGKLLIHLFRNGAGYLQYFDPVTGKALWKNLFSWALAKEPMLSMSQTAGYTSSEPAVTERWT